MAGRYPEEGCPRECVCMWRDPDRSPARPHGGTLRQNVSANSCCDTSTETRKTFKTKSNGKSSLLRPTTGFEPEIGRAHV
jgi:hypothetical protein